MIKTHWRKLHEKGYESAVNGQEKQMRFSEAQAKKAAKEIREKHPYFAQAVHVKSPGADYWLVMHKRK